MLINPVNNAIGNFSFGRKLHLDSAEIGKEAFWDEAVKSEQVRKRTEIKAPIYGHTRRAKNELCAEYEVNGKKADIITNPIKKEHFESLFKNFLALDKAGILHKNLSLDHLYFSDDGDVDMDGYRYSTDFYFNNGKFKGAHLDEDTTMPSNAQEFAETGLAKYVTSMKSEKAQFEFLKKYLPAKSKYHMQRAIYLRSDEGMDEDSRALREELIKTYALSAPSDFVLRNELDKLNLYAMGNQAFEMWKDGCGAFDGVKKPNKRINSVLLLFDCLKYGMQLRDKANSLASFCSDGQEAEYFGYEREYFNDFNKQLIECIDKAGKKTFTRKTFARKPFTVVGGKTDTDISKEAKVFEQLCSKINVDMPYDDMQKNINEAVMRYGSFAYKDSDNTANTPDGTHFNYA